MIPSPGLTLTAHQGQMLQGGIALFCSISLISSVLIIFTHFYFVHVRKNALKIVMLMSICIAGSDLTALIFINGGNCNVYSLLTTFFVIAAVLWSMVLSRTVALVLNRNALSSRVNRLNQLTNYVASSRCRKWLAKNADGMRMFIFHLIVWGVAATCSVSMLIEADNQPSISNWCWFENDVDTNASSSVDTDNVGTTPDTIQLCLFFVPIVLSLIYNCKTLFWASCKHNCSKLCTDRARDMALLAHETNETDLQYRVDSLISALKHYIFITILVCVWLCVAELVNVLDPMRKNIIWTYAVLLAVLRLQGFCNALIYFNRSDVRRAWYEWIWGCMGWSVVPALRGSTGFHSKDRARRSDGQSLEEHELNQDFSDSEEESFFREDIEDINEMHHSEANFLISSHEAQAVDAPAVNVLKGSDRLLHTESMQDLNMTLSGLNMSGISVPGDYAHSKHVQRNSSISSVGSGTQSSTTPRDSVALQFTEVTDDLVTEPFLSKSNSQVNTEESVYDNKMTHSGNHAVYVPPPEILTRSPVDTHRSSK